MEKKNSKESIQQFAYFLKELNCPQDILDVNSIQDILFRQGKARNDLLLWVIKETVSLEFHLHEQRTFDNSVKNKILNELCTAGICSSNQDMPLIEGTASVKDQVMLWKLLLIFCLNKNKYSRIETVDFDNRTLLLDIVESPYYSMSLQKEVDILPLDLKKSYKNWQRERNLDDLSDNLNKDEDELRTLQKKLFTKGINLDEGEKSEMAEPPIDLLENVNRLISTCKLLESTHATSFKPWCVESNGEEKTDAEMERLISETNSKLNALLEHIHLQERAETDSVKIGNEMEKLKSEFLHHSSATSILNSLKSFLKDK